MKLYSDPSGYTYRDTLRIKNRKGGRTSVGIHVNPELDGYDLQENSPLCIVYNPHSGIPHVKHSIRLLSDVTPDGYVTSGDDRALVLYYANHPRQRLQLDDSTGLILSVGEYGAAVVAVMAPNDRLVFRHRQFVETLHFDGKDLRTETREDTDVAGCEQACSTSGNRR